MRNTEIAVKLEEIADLLEIEEENPFRIRAYRNAARTLRGLGREVAAMLKAGEDLSELPGIGKDLAAKISELVESGSTEILDKLHRELPESLSALLAVPGLGPKRVKVLHEALGVDTPEALARAAKAGKLRSLPGFGAKTEARVLEALGAGETTARRFGLAEVTAQAEALVEHLQGARGVGKVTVAGSFRRRRETVGDLDILAIAAKPEPVMQRFVEFNAVARVASRGPTRSTLFLKNGLQVDLRVVPKESYGAALHYFTGSKAHNIRVRARARGAGLKINEYGVYRGARRIAGATEAEVFRAVGLPFVPPELREDRGEIEAALAGRLPRLVERADLRGDLHAHTTASDGRLGLEALARAARAAGLDYLAITDHAQHLGIVRGLDAGGLARQGEAIDRLNEKLRGIRLLKGVEVDILPDGRLALPDEALRGLDVVIAAVHTSQGLSRAKQTARVLRALEHPAVAILAHPTGRLLGERGPMQLDLERIAAAAARRGVALELNTQPARLDLDDVGCRAARDAGALVSIASDAHDAAGFVTLDDGVTQARRGWLEAGNVLNTRPLRSLLPLLAATRR